MTISPKGRGKLKNPAFFHIRAQLAPKDRKIPEPDGHARDALPASRCQAGAAKRDGPQMPTARCFVQHPLHGRYSEYQKNSYCRLPNKDFK